MAAKSNGEVDPTAAESFNQAGRQAYITEQVLVNGFVQVDELAEFLGVSRMTIYRDFDDLEKQGVLRKVRNGATAMPSSHFESNVQFRLNRQAPEKEAMGRAMLQWIEPGDSLILDEATTLLPLVRQLPEIAPLTVITNFLPIVQELKAHKDIHLVALGGEYLPRFDTFTGLLTEQTLSGLHADLYVTSTSAVANAAAFHPDQQVVSVKRAMMRRATSRYLLVDHTKFNKTALHEFAPLTSFTAVVVDAGLDPAVIEKMQASGVRVEVAPL